MASGIYRIVNLSNGKAYIGSAVSLERRKRDHFRELAAGTHYNQRLQRSWNKYGPEVFRFEVLEVVEDKARLTQIESTLIERHSTFKSKFGYNICRTGRSALGVVRTPETRAKMSAAQKGRVCSAQTRANMSASRRGKPFSEERKARLRGIKRSPKYCAAAAERLKARLPLSAEIMAKISASLTGRAVSAESRAKMSQAAKGNTSALGHSKSKAYRVELSKKARKLTAEQVLWIREQRSIGVIRPTLASVLGVSVGTVRNAELRDYYA